MRFKLDENLPGSLVSVLVTAGHDAVPAVDQSLQGTSDAVLAKVCRQEKRALVTLDLGFADIRAYPPSEYSGIIVLRLKRQEIPHLRATVGRLAQLMVDHPLEKMLWIVEDKKVRFRG